MSVPGIVQSTLGTEEIVARVSLGGDDELFITPTDSIIYRADGLLSDESVEEFPHDADRLTISDGRRKTRFTLEYALDGTREFTVPSGSTDDVLTPLVAGVLNGNGISDAGEEVIRAYRFSELTLIVTSDRLVKHIGEAVWDEDFEQYHFDDVTNLSFEDGSVATQIVLEVEGRPKRIKAPNDEAADLRERLERALFAYHGVDSLAHLNDAVGHETEPEPSEDPATAFGEGVDPLDANPPAPEDLDQQSAGESSDGPNPTQASSADSDAVTGAGSTAVSSTESNPNTRADSSPAASAETTTEMDAGSNQRSAVETAPDGETDPQQVDPLASGSSRDESSDQHLEPETADRSSGPETDETEDVSDDGGPDAADDGAESTSTSFGESGFTAATAGTDPELLERLDELEETVARQTAMLEKQQQTIEQLIAELRQGR
ncbi:DUF7115 domain-containing protein [Halostagnicola kamekurae]|uniref:DUF7115 domain-containing protein n=1 Tax=Halostagnicola kamekurae TaxID=619731 RepID=A0A1I6QHM2_9EURY|nr:hypothetical protein [Halostagnicola kamekurae]SFS51912.1 hypothetical protein SAMN04488556_1276 [Halostagnicola kamekurae]